MSRKWKVRGVTGGMYVRGKLSDWFVQENDDMWLYLVLWYWEETETQMEKPLDVTDQESHEIVFGLKKYSIR